MCVLCSLALLAVAEILAWALSLSCIEFNCTLYTTETLEKERNGKGRVESREEWRESGEGQDASRR